MSWLMRRIFQRTRPEATTRTPVGFIVQLITAGVAIWSTTALIGHHVISTSQSYGPSMYPTISHDLSQNIISRMHKKGKGVRIGDVVIFESPIFLRGSACKRIVGMPGDYVLRDEAQSATAGGVDMRLVAAGASRGEDHDHDHDGGETDDARVEPMMVQVPEGHVWVAGDNMAYSRDSRFYGPVPMALITGKVLYNGDGWFNWTSFTGSQLKPVEDGE